VATLRCLSFEVSFSERSEAQALELHRNGRPEIKRLSAVVTALRNGPIPDKNAIPLVGLANSYRYRLGRLRVLYEVDLEHCSISIVKVTLRDESTYGDQR
jgi:mRNA-degrading endonuclease RelE of RelBE toxin-antitoxin system